jgi:hypothetical protein
MQLDIQIVASFDGASAYLLLQTAPGMIAGETETTECAKYRQERKERSRCRAAWASRQSIQGRDAAAGAGDPRYDHGALNAIKPFLEAGESAVGTGINVRHLAATPFGHNVCAEAEVIRTAGRQIVFKVSARDATEEIGNGTHQRTVINLQSFNEHLAKKRER